MTIEAWLQRLGLGRYAEAFRENAVDEDLLVSLTAEDLRDLGVERVGDRRRILNAIAELRGEAGGNGGSAAASDARTPLAPQAERRMVTVLFCDMVGSTELSTLFDPEELGEVMKRFQGLCAEAVERFDGYVARLMGDGLLAYFGYPQASENGPECALRAGLAILEELRRTDLGGETAFKARVGVATGLAVVGEVMGDGSASEQTIVGETPNLAARFQQLAEPGTLVCGAVTKRLAGELFEYESLGRQPIKGFAQPVPVFRVLSEGAAESRFAATRQIWSARLVGRSQEKALIQDRWETSQEGEGQGVLLIGDPGIGKSRLLQDFLREVDENGCYRISFQCSPHYQDSALYPAIRQLEIAARFQSGDGPESKREKLAAALAAVPGTARFQPVLETLLGLRCEPEGEEALSPEQQRQAILRAVCDRIIVASQTRPVLCIVEDVHWIDPSTEELFSLLLERVPRHRILVLATSRQEGAGVWSRLPQVTSLKLNRLSRAQSRKLIGELLGAREAPPALIEEVLEKTDGIPLFIEEVIRALLESEALNGRETGEPGGGRRTSLQVPDSLKDTLLSRLDRDQLAKQVAQVASVIGREFSFELLQALSGMSEEEVRGGLESLLSASLIVRSATSHSEYYAFRHGLLHEAAYGTLLMRRCRSLHRQLAEILERDYPEVARLQPELLARHYDEAGMIDRAAEGWLVAGRHALGRGAFREAMQHLEAGLASVSLLPETLQRHALELPLQMAMAETQRSARFTSGEGPLRVCERARQLCELLGDTQSLIRVLRLELGITFNRPDTDGMARVAEQFVALAAKSGEPLAEILGEQSLGCLTFFRGEPKAARAHLLRAVQLGGAFPDAKALRDLQFPMTALSYLSCSSLFLGDPGEAYRHSARAIDASQGISKFSELLTYANSLIFALLVRDEALYADRLEALRALAEVRGAPYWIDLVGLHDGLRAAGGGETREGLRLVERALETFKANAIEIEAPFYLAVLAERLAEQGQREKALRALRDAMARAEQTGERWCLSELYRLRGEIMAEEEPASAEVDLRQAIAVAERQGSPFWALRAAGSLLRLAGSKSALEFAAGNLKAAVAGFAPESAIPDLEAARALMKTGALSA